jgi:RNA 2',3'-cyclic 3'-phosphodiesterase
MGLHRLFVAIELPNETKVLLRRLQETLPGARWVPIEQLHLTLRFIGEVDEETLTAIQAALSRVASEPFTIALQQIGHFPPHRQPRVLWVGLSAGEQLNRLQQQVEATLQTAGVAPDDRPFSPHITLARLRETPAAPVLSYEQRHKDFHCPPFAARAFHLYESRLSAKGATHTPLRSYPLAEIG